MTIIVLHGSAMTDHTAAHRELARAFGFPDWYGANLDALADLLRDHPKATVIWQGYGMAVAQIGDYADRIEAVIGAFDHLDLQTD